MKKMLFSKNEAFLFSKNGILPRKSEVIFRFRTLKLPKKMFGVLTPFQKNILMTSVIYGIKYSYPYRTLA